MMPAATAPAGAFLGPGETEFVACPSGALWWPDERTLIVSDLHLEKGSSYARSRQFLPPYDTVATLNRLAEAIARHAPRRVVALGDSFHDAGGPARLDAQARATLAALMAGREWIWISGNHDPALPPALGGTMADEIALAGIRLCHEPHTDETGAEIAGHLHPVACVRARGRIAGRVIRRRCFASGGNRLVMPAFGALAGGLSVLAPAFSAVVPPALLTAHVIGRDRVFTLPASALA